MDRKKEVDESWKQAVAAEKEKIKDPAASEPSGNSQPAHEHEGEEGHEIPDVDFASFVSSLAFQALIFLGEIPNPMDENQVSQNLPQAKYIIDTLVMFRDKTKGNLSKEEDEVINVSIYELQVKYIAHSKQGV